MERILIHAEPKAYSPKDLKLITVGELINLLEKYDEDAEVCLCFDSGRMFGNINRNTICEDDE